MSVSPTMEAATTTVMTQMEITHVPALQQLAIAKIQLYTQSLPMLPAQTHSYVL